MPTLALTDRERVVLRSGARSRDPFIRRRCRVLLALARGLSARAAAAAAGCSHQSVHNAVAAFRAGGLSCLKAKRRGPSGAGAWPTARDADLVALLRRSPSDFGRTCRRWTLALLAEVSCELGWAPRVFCPLTIRHALERQGVRWAVARRRGADEGESRGRADVPA